MQVKTILCEKCFAQNGQVLFFFPCNIIMHGSPGHTCF